MIRVPTPELIESSCEAFESYNATDERALTELFHLFPENTDAAQVLLKVVAVNSIYSTNIFAVKLVAAHVQTVGKELDERIQAGSLSAFDLIEYFDLGGEKRRWCFSFASKYLSWHRSDIYPIYDSRVDRYLTALIKHEHLPYKGSSSWTYQYFREVIDGVRTAYGLQSFTYKQLDAFFYEEGAESVHSKD